MEKEKILINLRNFLVLLTLIFVVLGFANLSKRSKVQTSLSPQSISTTTATNISKSTTTPVKVVSNKDSLKPCPVGNTDFDCYDSYYKYLVKKKGVSAAFSSLKEEYKKNPYVVAQCHPIAHVIGHAGLALYGSVAEAFKHGDPYCWSGYYHGVMEEISEKIGAIGIERELNDMCAGIPGKVNYSFDYYNCVHGLGHGVMAVNDDELFVSLKMCDSLTGEWEKQSCYGGVYMENIIIDNKGEKAKYLRPEEPMYPCTAVDVKYKSACYLMQSSYALKVTGGDFAKVFNYCKNSDVDFRATCYQSIGRDASGQSSSNVDATRAKCYLGEDYEEKSNCVVGAVKDFISYFHSDVEAKNFCNSLTSDLNQICLDTATSYYRSF